MTKEFRTRFRNEKNKENEKNNMQKAEGSELPKRMLKI